MLALILAAVIFGGWYFPEKFRVSSFIQNIINRLTPEYQLRQQVAELQKENENLRAQIFDQSITQTSTIKVYSSYPFNNNQYIVLAAGSNQGLKVGDVVTYGTNLLVGQLTSVSPNESVAETIFNPNWEMAVRIGTQQVNALFRGGIELKVTLIPKSLPVNNGDLAVTASQGFPYGLEVGSVQSVTDDVGTPYKEATLQAPFKLEDLRDVSIIHS
ncbi:MAG: rod shape-determining protein MreC [Patescibacteria group bacterium]|nr:rod shape-determining protein MreC [Patescibacteria group bacterium]